MIIYNFIYYYYQDMHYNLYWISDVNRVMWAIDITVKKYNIIGICNWVLTINKFYCWKILNTNCVENICFKNQPTSLRG